MDTSASPLPPPSMPRFSVDCPSRPILDQVADKWSMMVLAVLERPTRFNEIKRQLEGVTQRVLTQTLRRLERNGLIRRRVLDPNKPLPHEVRAYAVTTQAVGHPVTRGPVRPVGCPRRS